MNIAYKLMANKLVQNSELKYLLWMALCELQQKTDEETVGAFDQEECFNIDDMLDYLGQELGADELEDYTDHSELDESSDYNGACYRIEYDLNYTGGEYTKFGKYAYVPAELVFALNGVHQAFEKHTGIDAIHIVHWSSDELFTEDGEEF